MFFPVGSYPFVKPLSLPLSPSLVLVICPFSVFSSPISKRGGASISTTGKSLEQVRHNGCASSCASLADIRHNGCASVSQNLHHNGFASSCASLAEGRQTKCACSHQTSRGYLTAANAYDYEDSDVISGRPQLPLMTTNSANDTRTSLDFHQYQLMDDDGNAYNGKSLHVDDSPWSTNTDYNYVYSEPKVYWDKYRKKNAVIRTNDDEEERYASSHDTRREPVDDDSMVTNILYKMSRKDGRR